jgi:hypothetical protein
MMITKEGAKRCCCCGEVKALSEFYKNKTTKDGLADNCKNCAKAYREKHREKNKAYSKAYRKENLEHEKERLRAYYETNREEVKLRGEVYRKINSEKIKVRSKAYRDNRRDLYALNGVKKRAKQKGLDFDITVADVIPPEFCPVLGLKLERGKGTTLPNSPSVDRIDPSKGYTKENIQVISQLANSMKQNATPEQLLMFADWIYKTYK